MLITDYDNLNKSLQKIEAISKYINEQKRNAQHIAQIEEKIGSKTALSLVFIII